MRKNIILEKQQRANKRMNLITPKAHINPPKKVTQKNIFKISIKDIILLQKSGPVILY